MWKEMLAAHEKRLEREHFAADRWEALEAGTERSRRVKCAQSLGQKAWNVKAAKVLAHSTTFDPATPCMLDEMRVLYLAPHADDPDSIISHRDLSLKLILSPDIVRTTLSSIYKDSVAVPVRVDVRCLWSSLTLSSDSTLNSQVRSFEPRWCRKIAVSDFSPDVSHLISSVDFITLNKSGSNTRPIVICVVFRRLIKKSLMPASISESKKHLAPLDVGCGVKSGFKSNVLDARDSFFKPGGDSTYIDVFVDTYNAFNKTSRGYMLPQTAEHSPSLIRFSNVLLAKGQLFLRF